MSSRKRESRGARVALISLYNWQFALGVRYLSAVLKERKHHVDTVFFKEMTRAPDPTYNLEVGAGAGEPFYAVPPSDRELEELVRVLKSLNPDLIGMSLMSSFLQLAKEITARVKSTTDVPVVWGGPHATLVPEECIEYTDIVCVGEGEGAIVDLADRISREESYVDVENLWVRREDGSVVTTPLRSLIADLDSLPFPDYDDENKHYILNGVHSLHTPEEKDGGVRIYDLMSSRGCPFSCSFCGNSCFREIFEGIGPYVRRRSVANVIGEVRKAMGRNEIDFVRFWDDVFTLDRDWIREFRDEWNRWVGLPFSCYAHPLCADEEILRTLKDCGMNIVTVGIQSGSERTNREVYDRRQKKEQIIRAAELFRDLGLDDVRWEVILDNPFEDERDHRETLDLLLSLPRPFALYTYSLCYGPKAKITERALAGGLISESDVEGRANKGVMEALISVRKAGPKVNRFWNTLISMTKYTFFPKGMMRWLSNRGILRNNPGLLSFVVVRVLKLVALKNSMVHWRTRGRQARRMGRNKGPLFEVTPVWREAREAIPTMRIRNRGSVPEKAFVCLDIYPTHRPRHPQRHLGFWGANLELPPGDTDLVITFSYPDARFRTEGREIIPGKVWTGSFKETGWYDVILGLRDPARRWPSKEHRLLRKRTVRIHSSELFGGQTKNEYIRGSEYQ